MLFITDYSFNAGMSKEQTAELMTMFAAAGSAPGTIAHYVNTDGSGGTVISDSDDPVAAYRNAINYGPWMTLSTRPVLTVEDAVPQIADYLG